MTDTIVRCTAYATWQSRRDHEPTSDRPTPHVRDAAGAAPNLGAIHYSLCATRRTAPDGCQQRRVMPTFGGRIHGLARADPACQLLVTPADHGPWVPIARIKAGHPCGTVVTPADHGPWVPIARIKAGHPCGTVATAPGYAVVPTARITAEPHKKYTNMYEKISKYYMLISMNIALRYIWSAQRNDGLRACFCSRTSACAHTDCSR
jgi:hypothetical protein